METRLIDANALLEEIDEEIEVFQPETTPSNKFISIGLKMAKKVIKKAPTVDAVPEKRGKWICVNDDENVWMCDNCGAELAFEVGDPDSLEMFFCPHCGADMGGGTDA